jgi:hypothetical protein
MNWQPLATASEEGTPVGDPGMTSVALLAVRPRLAESFPGRGVATAVVGEASRDGLRRRLEHEIRAALREAAGAQTQLGGMSAATPGSVHRLDLAADRCRSATFHISQAARAAAELDRLEGSGRG